MASAFVQSWAGNSVTNVETLSVTVSGATANNLLVASCSFRRTNAFTVDPAATGWTVVEVDVGQGGSAAKGAMFQRIASGDTNDDFEPSWTGISEVAIVIGEYSGLAAASPLEDSDETPSAGSATEVSAGTATAVQATGRAIAMLAVRSNDTWSPGLAVDSSFAVDATEDPGSNSNPLASIASLGYAANGAKSTTWSTTGAGGVAFAAIGVFKEAAAGGAAHTITGAGSIALTGAAAMLEGRVLAGAGAVSLTGAAQMLEGRFLDGAGSLALSGAAQMVEGRVLAGAGSIALAGTAALEGPENAIDGAGTIALAGSADMVEGRVLAGAGAIALTGAAAMLEGRVIAGAGSVELTGAAALEGPQNELVGAGVVTLAGDAAMLEGRALDGAGAITVAGAAQMLEGRVLDATGQLALTGAAVMAHTVIGSATIADVYTLLRQLALGKVVTRRATGTYELYDPDLDTLVYTGPLFEDEAETIPFGPDSDGADVRGKLEPP